MVKFMKKATLTIDLDAILYNYRHLKCKYNKNIIAVLKDDAYGLGLVKVANKLKDEQNIIFAISSLDEAILLRNNNINNDILYLNVFDYTDISTILKYNITVVVSNFSQLDLVKKHSLNFHLKFNTGMNRIGFYKYELNNLIKEINSYNYNLKGVMTHIADDDKNHECYYKFIDIVNKINYTNLIIHCFASTSLTTFKDDITNYIRVGIKLYGIENRGMFLHNAISLTSPIIQVKQIDADQAVGYDYTYKTPQKGYLYVLPIGYNNGWGSFKNSFAYYENIYLKQAGKISMDYSTYFTDKLIDDKVEIELLGKHINIEQICELNNLNPHELLTRFKINKVYIEK